MVLVPYLAPVNNSAIRQRTPSSNWHSSMSLRAGNATKCKGVNHRILSALFTLALYRSNIRTESISRRCTAKCNAQIPSIFGMLGLAFPCRNKNSVIWARSAKCNGVSPSSSCAFTTAPRFNKTSAIPMSNPIAARCIAVRPYLSP